MLINIITFTYSSIVSDSVYRLAESWTPRTVFAHSFVKLGSNYHSQHDEILRSTDRFQTSQQNHDRTELASNGSFLLPKPCATMRASNTSSCHLSDGLHFSCIQAHDVPAIRSPLSCLQPMCTDSITFPLGMKYFSNILSHWNFKTNLWVRSYDLHLISEPWFNTKKITGQKFKYWFA